jgi:hypothetical protein
VEGREGGRKEGGREGGWEGGRVGGREGGRERGRAYHFVGEVKLAAIVRFVSQFSEGNKVVRGIA